jgi:hypothetical protein
LDAKRVNLFDPARDLTNNMERNVLPSALFLKRFTAQLQDNTLVCRRFGFHGQEDQTECILTLKAK